MLKYSTEVSRLARPWLEGTKEATLMGMDGIAEHRGSQLPAACLAGRRRGGGGPAHGEGGGGGRPLLLVLDNDIAHRAGERARWLAEAG